MGINTPGSDAGDAEVNFSDKINNFVRYLPGGGRYQDYRPDALQKKIITAVNQALAKDPIDLKTFFAKFEEGSTLVLQALNLGKNDPGTAREMGNKGNTLMKEAFAIINPLFDKMVALGFDPRDLAR